MACAEGHVGGLDSGSRTGDGILLLMAVVLVWVFVGSFIIVMEWNT